MYVARAKSIFSKSQNKKNCQTLNHKKNIAAGEFHQKNTKLIF